MTGVKPRNIAAEPEAGLRQANAAGQNPEATPVDRDSQEPLWKRLVDKAKGVREDVSQVPATPTSHPNKPENPEEIQSFLRIIRENRQYHDAIASLEMTCRLLRTSYRHGGLDIAQMGFSKQNLEDLIRAVMSQLRGRMVPEQVIKKGLRDSKRLPMSFIYEDLLALTKDSDDDSIRKSLTDLVAQIEKLEDLDGYESIEDVMGVLKKCAREKDPKKIAKIIADAGFDNTPKHFDTDKLSQMLDQSGKLVQEYMATRQLPIDAPLQHLHEVAQAKDLEQKRLLLQYFNSKSLAAVQRKIDALFPEASDMGVYLLAAAAKSNHYEAVLRAIVDRCQVTDLADLDKRLSGLYNLFCHRFPNALAEQDPVRQQMDESLHQLYCEILDQSKGRHAKPYWQLGKAFAMSDSDYDQTAKDSLFNGKSREAVMAEIDLKIGQPGFAATLMDAAQRNEHYDISLFRVVALAYGLKADDPQLKACVIHVGHMLGKLFPKLRD